VRIGGWKLVKELLMKRAGMCSVMAFGALMAAGMTGCERQDAALPDAQYDGVLPHPKVDPDPRILTDDQAKNFRDLADAAGASAPKPAPVATTSAPAATETGTPESTTPITPPGDATPAAPAPPPPN
jgi:hypothetical protein